MDLLLLLKLVWVGGASVLTLAVVLLDRRGDGVATLTGVSHIAALGSRLLAPVGLLTIGAGLTLAWLGGRGFAAWTSPAAVQALGVLGWLRGARAPAQAQPA